MTGARTTLLLGLMLLAGPARGEEPVLLAVGDSITKDPDGVPSFIERLELPGIRIVNLGCGGASLADWAEERPRRPGRCYDAGSARRLDAWIGKVAGVHVMLGSNDSTGFAEPGVTSPEDYRRLLEKLVGRFEAPVFVSVPPPNALAVRPLFAYREQILEVVRTRDHVHLGADFLLAVPFKYLHDGVHPDAAGHAFMAGLLRPGLAARLTPAD